MNPGVELQHFFIIRIPIGLGSRSTFELTGIRKEHPMAMSTWFALGVICLLYVALGLWAVSQIFPHDRAATPGFDPKKQQERSRT